MSPGHLWAQTDTTSVQFTSEEATQEQWNKKVKLRKIRDIILHDATSVWSLGVSAFREVGPAIFKRRNTFPYDSYHYDISLAYERKIFGPDFSMKIELLTRLTGYEGQPYDYGSYVFDRSLGITSSGVFGQRKAWFNIAVKYFYNKQRKYLEGRSGDNPFGQYFKAELISPLAISEETVLRWRPAGAGGAVISTANERINIISGPAFINLGWGIQQPFLKVLMVDANVGVELSLDEKYTHTGRTHPVFRLRLGYLIIK